MSKDALETGLFVAATALLASPALGQNLYAPAPPAPAGAPAESATDAVASMSLLYVSPPEPRVIAAHDIITILIDESSAVSAEQTLDTKKEMTTNAQLNQILDPWELLELRLRTGDLTDLTLVDADADREFKGDGEYERTDRFTARIAATVLEVKPNGTIVLEARKRIVKDEEIQVLVLSGRVRQDDVTDRNTILSSQIAELTIAMNNEGQVNKAARKGLITRVLDTIFSF